VKKLITILAIALSLTATPLLGSAQQTESSEAAAADDASRYAGNFRFSQSRSAGQGIINGAIERDTEDMSFVTRGIARGRLEDKNSLVSSIDIAVRDGNIVIRLDGRRYTAPADGSRASATDPQGNSIQISHAYRNGKIIQTFYSDSGQRRNVFTLGGNGTTMQLNVRVTSDSLSGPVRYGLRYRRG